MNKNSKRWKARKMFRRLHKLILCKPLKKRYRNQVRFKKNPRNKANYKI